MANLQEKLQYLKEVAGNPGKQLAQYLRQGRHGLECEDSTDYRLPVSPGELLTVVRETSAGFLCKKQGVTGWYYGRLSDIME